MPKDIFVVLRVFDKIISHECLMPLLTLTFNISPSVRCAGILKFGFFDEILKKKNATIG
ncbi:hypothetical protein HanIR_Chr02g0081851 [Helianthus annuus]|nr:hypothetical protein HanIR_Chr02g0081851 [Helianthus annuus]